MPEEEEEQETPITEEPVTEVQETPEDMVSKATAVAERIEAANKETAKLQARHDAILVEQTLGGQTLAGKPTMSKEEKAIANAKEFLKGTGLEEEVFPSAN